MAFSFPSKEKENNDLAQTVEIKEAASLPDFNKNNSNTNSSFQNPFNQPQQQNPFEQSQQQNPFEQSQDENFSQEPQNSNENMYNSIANELHTNNQYNENNIQEMIDETIEKVIEERWEKLVTGVEKVLKWKEKQEAQINLIKEDIVHIKEAMMMLEKKLLGKINSYDSNIMDVNSEIKALEKVFQKITPTLINNVNELSKIAEDIKHSKKKENDDL